MMFRFLPLMLFLAAPAAADILVAARTLPAQTIITAEDLALREGTDESATDDALLLIGMETRVAIYAGRPVRPADLGAPALVDRNEIVPLVFESGALRISTDGRALGRGGVGETIRVMNLSSRNTVTARIAEDGTLWVIGNGS